MEWIASPNHGPRKSGGAPRLVVIHYTAMRGGSNPVIEHFRDPEVQLSAHYVLGRNGRLVQMVDESRRAWHAGIGRWGAFTDVNSFSLGIELCNEGDGPFGARQIDALEDLLRDILTRHAIPPEGVIGHSDSAPGRKIDPGPRFDWRRLSRHGLSVWPEMRKGVAVDYAVFQDALHRFGYRHEVEDEVMLSAFRLRFRPTHRGPLDAVDMGMAVDLAERWPFEQRDPIDVALAAQ